MKEKHIHKLKRLRYKSGNEIFFCALPDCSYKSNVALSLGKRSICWRCGQDFKTKYIIECWNPYTNKYNIAWTGNNLEVAERLFNKHYFQTRTRRLLRIQTEILYQEKARID